MISSTMPILWLYIFLRTSHVSSFSCITLHRAPLCSAFKATIYYPEDDEGPALEDDVHVTYNSQQQMLLSSHEEMTKKLSMNQTTLAHLASAFSPVDYPVNLERIDSIRCVSIDNKHLEVEATLCDDIECNSLLIPVNFPNECLLDGEYDTKALNECIMTNVDELDREAENKLFHEAVSEDRRAEQVYETLQSATRLLEDAPAVFPDWWVAPNTKEDVSESKLLKDLLNEEDMTDARIDLIRHHHNLTDDTVVLWAKVMVVAPRGLILKFHTSVSGSEYGSVAKDSLIIKFCKGNCTIREKVLQLLATTNVE